MKKVGIIGTGEVGKTLALGFQKHGWSVQIGSRDPKKLDDWVNEKHFQGQILHMDEVIALNNLIVLAIKAFETVNFVKSLGNDRLTGKTIIDVNNPIANEAPENGVLRFFTSLDKSLMEQLQDAAPGANFVKAFSCVGSPWMVNPPFTERPTMFICGNNTSAKAQVKEILDAFGWETEDMGKVTAARAIEPLCILWCIPGMLHNQWSHAFKLLKLN